MNLSINVHRWTAFPSWRPPSWWKKPGASWRTAENFKYPSWQQPKLSARIYRAAAHVFSLLCTRMLLSRKRQRRRKEEKREKKYTYICIHKCTYKKETRKRVWLIHFVQLSFEASLLQFNEIKIASWSLDRKHGLKATWCLLSFSLSLSPTIFGKNVEGKVGQRGFSRSRSRRPWYVARSMNHRSQWNLRIYRAYALALLRRAIIRRVSRHRERKRGGKFWPCRREGTDILETGCRSGARLLETRNQRNF